MRCKICKSESKDTEDNIISLTCSFCVQKKTLEYWSYESFKPKEKKIKYCKCCKMFEIGWKKKLKKKQEKVDNRIEKAKAKISKWNDRLKKRRV
jgi:hypothetical protein